MIENDDREKQPDKKIFLRTKGIVSPELPAFYGRANLVVNRNMDTKDGNDVAGVSTYQFCFFTWCGWFL